MRSIHAFPCTKLRHARAYIGKVIALIINFIVPSLHALLDNRLRAKTQDGK